LKETRETQCHDLVLRTCDYHFYKISVDYEILRLIRARPVCERLRNTQLH